MWFVQIKTCRRARGLGAAIRVGVLAALVALANGSGARADYRSCQAWYVISPSDGSGTIAGSDRFTARAGVTVGPPLTNITGSEYDDARAYARQKIEDCVGSHWANPHSPSAPAVCVDNDGPGRAGLHDYPFGNLIDGLARLVCAANPGQDRITVDIYVSVDGRTGCIPPPNQWAIPVARSFDLTCGMRRIQPQPPAMERVTPDAPRQIVPLPDLRPVAPPLPNTRLPGLDLAEVDITEPRWQLCEQACDAASACRAWTYRAPTTRRGPRCLLKRGVPAQVSDACCHSGIK